MPNEVFSQWCVLELMGHRRLAGLVTDATIGGGAFLRIDIPTEEGEITQYYSPGSIYCITPTTEEMARLAAREMSPAPISRWEVKELMQRRLPFNIEKDLEKRVDKRDRALDAEDERNRAENCGTDDGDEDD